PKDWPPHEHPDPAQHCSLPLHSPLLLQKSWVVVKLITHLTVCVCVFLCVCVCVCMCGCLVNAELLLCQSHRDLGRWGVWGAVAKLCCLGNKSHFLASFAYSYIYSIL